MRGLKSKKDCLLSLDIGTEFVKAIIFKVERNFLGDEKKKRGVVIGYGRCRQTPGNMFSGAVANIDGVALTCQKAIEEAARTAKTKPSRAVIGVAGEFVKGSTTSFSYQRPEPKKKLTWPSSKILSKKPSGRPTTKRGALWRAKLASRKLRFVWSTP